MNNATFTDSHCHIHMCENPDAVIESAMRNGVGLMVNIGTNVQDWEITKSFAQKHENIYYALGVHPLHAHTINARDLKSLIADHADEHIIAIGECGMDSFRENDSQKLLHQEHVFRAHIDIAIEMDIPINMHIRGDFAMEKSLAVCNEYVQKGANAKFIFHCYCGTDESDAFITNTPNAYASFSGVLAFKNCTANIINSAKNIPLNKILTETDTPYLSPLRGRVNAMENVRFVYDALAKYKGIDVDDIKFQVLRNFNTALNI